MTVELQQIPGEQAGVYEAVPDPDQRVAQLTVLFWGMLFEQVGEQVLNVLGVHSGNMAAMLGTGVLDSNMQLVREFVRLYSESNVKDQLPVFVRGVVAMAEQAKRNVDERKGDDG